MTHKVFSAGLLAIAASLLLAAGAPSAAVAAGSPATKILVVDRSAVLRASKVGQDIMRQVKAYDDQAQQDLKGQAAALRQAVDAFKQQSALLAADVKARKMKDLEARQAGLQQLAQKKGGLIQGGFYKARQDVDKALGQILQGIMVERGASLLLDRSVVLMGLDRSLDITELAVQRLDQKMTTMHVELLPPPPELLQQQAQQQAQQQ